MGYKTEHNRREWNKREEKRTNENGHKSGAVLPSDFNSTSVADLNYWPHPLLQLTSLTPLTADEQFKQIIIYSAPSSLDYIQISSDYFLIFSGLLSNILHIILRYTLYFRSSLIPCTLHLDVI